MLSVDLRRVSKLRKERKAIAPKFPKQKEEGWFLILGSKETKELIAMKRVPYISKRATHQVSLISHLHMLMFDAMPFPQFKL